MMRKWSQTFGCCKNVRVRRQIIVICELQDLFLLPFHTHSHSHKHITLTHTFYLILFLTFILREAFHLSICLHFHTRLFSHIYRHNHFVSTIFLSSMFATFCMILNYSGSYVFRTVICLSFDLGQSFFPNVTWCWYSCQKGLFV